MNVARSDDPVDTPRESDTSYPPRQTGKYKIRDLPTEIPLPPEVRGKPDEAFFTFVRDQFGRQDEITREERFALTSYRSYVDDKLEAAAREAVELREMVVQAVGVLRDLGTTVAELGSGVRQLRRCMRKLEATVHLSNTEVKNIGVAQAEFEGRVIAAQARLESRVDAQLEELWAAMHRIEEELEIQEEDDGAETDETGSAGDADPE